MVAQVEPLAISREPLGCRSLEINSLEAVFQKR